MNRVLGIELRRSAAAGAALTLLVAGVVLLELDGWRSGWMPLVSSQRYFLVLLWPLAVAAGAWQGRRESRSRVEELFASTALPRHRRVLPAAVALALAMVAAYLVTAAIEAVITVPAGSYLPAAAFAVTGVGMLSLVAAAWVGMAVGRSLPQVVTAPALTVVLFGLLLTATTVRGGNRWIMAMLTPMIGSVPDPEFSTVPARASWAQGIWLAALAVTGLALLAAGGLRARGAAVLPAVLGVVLAVPLMPHSGQTPELAFDPGALRLVCADGTPRVCVTRVHADALAKVTPMARQGLAMLARLPGAPTTAVEDYGWLHPELQPQRPQVALIWFTPLVHGESIGPERFLVGMLSGYGGRFCRTGHDTTAATRASAYWLMGREPTVDGPGFGARFDDPEVLARTRRLWQGLRALPEREAAARVAAVRAAAVACTDTDLEALLAGRTA